MRPRPSVRSASAWRRPASSRRSPASSASTPTNHIVAYTDGEIRQQYENSYIGRPVGGTPTINDEADGVRFAQPADLAQYDIHPSMR